MTFREHAGQGWRSVSQFHEQEVLVRFAQTLAGRILACAAGAALLYPSENGKATAAAVVLVSLFPKSRRLILSLGAFAVSGWKELLKRLAVIGPEAVLFLGAKHMARLPGLIRRRPQIWLHTAIWVFLAITWLVPEHRGVWYTGTLYLASAYPLILWRCGYLLQSGKRGSAAKTGFFDHLFYLHPLHLIGIVPVGKGHDYLRRAEAQSSEQLARAQLAGVKLLLLSWLWRFVGNYLGGVADGVATPLFNPVTGAVIAFPLEHLIHLDVPASLLERWVSSIVELIRVIVLLAATGHLVVGFLRLSGFYIARNTYKPLLSETLVDFWNRYFYYFKEVLVDFFFFPTFLRFPRLGQRARMFLATFAAAFLGNLYFHVLTKNVTLAEANFGTIWQFMEPRLVYSFLLALGIFVSMVRQEQARGRPLPARGPLMALLVRARRIACVSLFFAVIHIWNLPSTEITLAQRNRFFLSLFGL